MSLRANISGPAVTNVPGPVDMPVDGSNELGSLAGMSRSLEMSSLIILFVEGLILVTDPSSTVGRSSGMRLIAVDACKVSVGA